MSTSGYEGRAHKVIGVLDCARGRRKDRYTRVKVSLWPDEVAIIQDIIDALGADQGADVELLPLLTIEDAGARTIADVEVRTE